MRRPSEAMERHLRQLGIICFATVSGVVIFAGVVWYLLSSGRFSPLEKLPPYFGLVFNLAALLFLVKAQLLPRLRPAPHAGAPEESYLAWHRINTILGFALREGGAFLALIGVLLTGSMPVGFATAGLAVVAMVLAWPRQDQIPDTDAR
jgi:hypothetical protein